MRINPHSQSPLPEFLHDISDIPETDSALSSHLLKKFFALIVLVWLALILLYVHYAFGFESFSALLPSEFAVFLAFVLIPPAVLILIVALISRTLSAQKQSALMEKSLNRFLLSGHENLLTQALSQSLKKEISALTESAVFLSQQTLALKDQINAKATDFAQTNEILNTFLETGLKKFNEGSASFAEQCRQAALKADEASTLYLQRIENLKNTARLLNRELEPLLAQTAEASQNLKQILDESKEQMNAHQARAQAFAETSRQSLENVNQILNTQSDKLEKIYRRTADNCNEIYKRLDNGISHIENSLKAQQKTAQLQSALLSEKSDKMGEYGRLINLEVTAMVERSATLDKNAKAQIATLSAASNKIERILEGANNSLEQKSACVVNNIEKTILNLESELKKMADFIRFTENKNTEIKSAAEKITRQIGHISADLGQKADDLKNRAVDAIDKFNEVNGAIKQSAQSLTETTGVMVAKGRESAEVLSVQEQAINRTTQELRLAEQQIVTVGNIFQESAEQMDGVVEKYKKQLGNLSQTLRERAEKLDQSRLLQEQSLKAFQTEIENATLQNFVAESEFIIENLENLSVDFNRFLNKDDDALWKKFYNGDHAIFARNVVKSLKRGQILKIRQAYEKDMDFRVIADRYMSGFEQLLAAAQKTEKSSILLSILSGSDIGKIYYVVARALGRLE